MRRPPPLQLLPAFDAAARHLSFSKAATELHVTTAAISQQIRSLEDHLQLALFLRLPRRVALTEAGVEFAAVARDVLRQYHQGHQRLIERHTQPVLRLSMTPLVAHELLIPRLSEFQRTHPGITLHLDARMDLVDFEHQALDGAIRLGPGDWPGLEVHALCDCDALVLAAPPLLAQHPVRGLDDLARHTLIHPRHSTLDWDMVAQALNVPRIPRQADLMLDSDLAALRAAEQGLGLAICVMPANSQVQALLRHPERLSLVLPPWRLPLPAYFVWPKGSPKEPWLRQALSWIQAQLNPSQLRNT